LQVLNLVNLVVLHLWIYHVGSSVVARHFLAGLEFGEPCCAALATMLGHQFLQGISKRNTFSCSSSVRSFVLL